MKFKSKVVTGELDKTVSVLVYYNSKNKNIQGDLINTVDGPCYKRNDGKVFPVLLIGDGTWMTVICERPDERVNLS